MEVAFFAVSLAVWAGVWVLVVKLRGRRGKLAAHIIGAILGLAISSVLIAALRPNPAPEVVQQATQSTDLQPIIASEPVQDEAPRGDLSQDAVEPVDLLDITREALAERFVSAAKQVPQCIGMSWSGAHPLMKKVSLGGVSADVYLKGDERLESVKIFTAGSARDQDSLQLMLCSTYAVIMAAQPDAFDMNSALSMASNVWARAKSAPADTAIGFYVIKSQLIPFQFELRASP